MRTRGLVTVLAGLLASAALGAAPSGQTHGDTPIASATLRVTRRTVPVARVTLTNTRNAPLETWRVRVGDTSGHAWTSGADFNGALVQAWPAGDGPIRPHEARTILVRLDAPSTQLQVTVTMAVFADGACEGDAAALRIEAGDRLDKGADLEYWLDALQRTPRTTSKEAEAFVQERADQLAQMKKHDPNYLRERLTSLFDGRRPADSVFVQLDNIQAEIAKRLAVQHDISDALNDPAVISGTARSATSVTSTVTTGETTDIVAVVANSGKWPIEAWRVEERMSAGSQAPAAARDPWSAAQSTNGVRVDTCGTNQQIRPGQSRDVFLHAADALPSGSVPSATLTLVVFDSLDFEGRKIDYDQVLRQREYEAETYQFWINALKAAASLPVDQLTAHLRETLADSPFVTSGSLDTEMAAELSRLDGLEARMPTRVASALGELRASLERRRGALLRHVK